MTDRPAILYAFYGDDFTGSTDVLEQLASNGVPAVLYLAPPTPAHLAAFPEARAIGIAGDSRSRSPKWMSSHLPGIFAALKTFHAPIVHYKVCSTFDSSPSHGSIGRAIELGREILGPHFVPIVVGAPHLRRYVAFGNLFVAAPDGTILRIDRHPMSHHPVTPMREADLRLHLRAQTTAPIGLLDITALRSGTAAESLEAQLSAGCETILFDTIDSETQSAAGELLWQEAQRQPLFSASSSGLTAAIIPAMRKAGLLVEPVPPATIEPSAPLLVISGSCSVVTERQIRYALHHGYLGTAVDAAALLAPPTAAAARAAAVKAAIASLNAGRDTILYTALGSPAAPAHGDRLGSALGSLLREIIARTAVRRVLLCGGDTSSYAIPQLGLYALTWLANLQPGAPLCRAYANDEGSHLHHLELVLKGGQVGTDDFFDVVRG